MLQPTQIIRLCHPELGTGVDTPRPEAEDELDRIADSAISEAKRFARNPEKLIILVERTRALGSMR